MDMEEVKVRSEFEALGAALDICARNGAYMNWTVADLNRYFVPPVNEGQYSIFVDKGVFVGFVTWAFLSRSLSDSLRFEHQEPPPSGWRSGTQIWIMDLICQSGYAPAIGSYLQKTVFRNTSCSEAFAVRRRADGTIRRIARYPRLDIGAREKMH